MSIVPFVLIWKGEAMRARSPFCNSLKSGDDDHKVSHINRSPAEQEQLMYSSASIMIREIV
ncbi:MFS general substrate transporter [Penicillium waksmanii]|uniref:MFS general substrate transporter n=1 Tax=Penicillium waksmanii TaxID=69791 RepID=UPI0025478718|nr:MFS general substrate transporter [Penicillium waksmanii]KAJ5980091.1 MFS general substrate transporter [Penicillium waksmanii]